MESKPRMPPINNNKLNKENFSSTMSIPSTSSQLLFKWKARGVQSREKINLNATTGASTSTPTGSNSSLISLKNRPSSRETTEKMNISSQSRNIQLRKPTPKAPLTDEDEMNNKKAEMNLKKALKMQKGTFHIFVLIPDQKVMKLKSSLMALGSLNTQMFLKKMVLMILKQLWKFKRNI